MLHPAAGQPGTTAWGDSVDAALVAVPATYARKDGRRVSVWDYGVVGDGVANDSAALQAAITAAGVGGYIDAGKGTHAAAVFKCLTGLTMLNFQTLDGSSFQVGVGTTGTAEIRFPSFTAAEVGLTLGDACVVKHLCLRGPGSAVGTCKGVVNTGAPQFHGVSIIHWATGAWMTGAYYTSFWHCEFSRNGTGLILSGCYNLSLFGTRFECRSSSGTPGGLGIDAGTVRGLNISGGSIESYGTAIHVGNASIINLDNVYFESACTGAYGITSGATMDQVVLNLSGCMVYLTDHNRWVNFSDATNSVLNSHGNKFTCPTTSSTSPFGFTLGTPQATTEVNLSGDSWAEVAKVPSYYTDISSYSTPGRNTLQGGPWEVVTPTVSGITQGNGTVTGRVRTQGKTVTGFIAFTVGSTTVMTGRAIFSLPYNAHDNNGHGASVMLREAGNGYFIAAAVIEVNVVLVGPSTSGLLGGFTTTTPFTWATGDQIVVDYNYERV